MVGLDDSTHPTTMWWELTQREILRAMTPRFVLTICCALLTGLGLYFAPDAAVSSVRGAITDAMRPGQLLLRTKIASLFKTSSETDSATENDLVERLKEELTVEREKTRRLQTQLAQLTEQYQGEQEISAAMLRTKRLIVPSLTEVAVLGDTVAEQWRSGKVLDQGSKNGLRENELVLSTRKPVRPLIDFGEDGDLSAEDLMLLGRCVIGKVEHVGRWTSTFLRVTDSRYRGRAQLIRETESGFVFEAQGILKGQGGPLCKLEGIPAERSVRVNDAVYTAERDGILPTPLYYGQVVEAELGMDDREWTVYVKPAEVPSQLTRVHVLRTAVNPGRLAVK
jgi:rod shape-determining protein MreC